MTRGVAPGIPWQHEHFEGQTECLVCDAARAGPRDPGGRLRTALAIWIVMRHPLPVLALAALGALLGAHACGALP